MPTLGEEPDGTPQWTPEVVQKLARSFGAEAARYDRTRPPYPDALINRIARPGLRAVDVGCGTGILSRQLRTAGCATLGVEPDERMAAFARQTGLDVEVSAFETWDPAGREFDAVVAGQSWHWVDPDAGPRQAARALRSGGLFVALWHVFAAPEPIARAFIDAYRHAAPDIPLRFGITPEEARESYAALLARSTDGFQRSGAFAEPARWRADWEHGYSTADYVALLPTMSPVAALTADQRTAVLDAVRVAIDAQGGEFVMPFSTIALAAVRS
ncbi:class I SAM-dependent methyltransferase [Lentzea sp. NPDC051213]|uniref:class I SAM-dependent methyltransferase n=1 Tax=Lentzea sp. NPDC051213 TaxID=3364126 RepID=UPI0037BBF8A0